MTCTSASRSCWVATGMEKIIEYKLNDEEKAMFEKSAASVKETHEALEEAGHVINVKR